MSAYKAVGVSPLVPGTELVSICVPHFNLGRFLPETLASIAAQDYPALDVLVIDDGSTNTALYAEVCNGPNVGGTAMDPRKDCFEFGAMTSTNLATARSTVLARSTNGAASSVTVFSLNKEYMLIPARIMPMNKLPESPKKIRAGAKLR